MDERERRRAKIDQIARAAEADSYDREQWRKTQADRRLRGKEALDLLAELDRTRDADTFKSAMESWGRRPGVESFSGINGQMFLNQVVNYSAATGEDAASLLSETLAVP